MVPLWPVKLTNDSPVVRKLGDDEARLNGAGNQGPGNFAVAALPKCYNFLTRSIRGAPVLITGIASFVVGVLLGHRCSVLALIPAVLIGGAALLLFELTQGSAFGVVLWNAFGMSVGLQAGYLSGLAMRKSFARHWLKKPNDDSSTVAPFAE